MSLASIYMKTYHGYLQLEIIRYFRLISVPTIEIVGEINSFKLILIPTIEIVGEIKIQN
jgi:hypothetical protein